MTTEEAKEEMIWTFRMASPEERMEGVTHLFSAGFIDTRLALQYLGIDENEYMKRVMTDAWFESLEERFYELPTDFLAKKERSFLKNGATEDVNETASFNAKKDEWVDYWTPGTEIGAWLKEASPIELATIAEAVFSLDCLHTDAIKEHIIEEAEERVISIVDNYSDNEVFSEYINYMEGLGKEVDLAEIVADMREFEYDDDFSES